MSDPPAKVQPSSSDSTLASPSNESASGPSPSGASPSDGKASPSGASGSGYRVLARKYRPTSFDQLIGQETLVRTLTNAVRGGRLAQAYMLTGVRGVGKTTTARLIARALNCVGPDGTGGVTITPCGQCDNCRAIMEDRHVDVLEMDAASRTGVNDIREILDGVRYRPTAARYKVYIIDEVHMLSNQAFNALLKTLEEPPEHVKFIFATTEIRKVPVTVLSRCQRFDLRRVSQTELSAHFGRVAEKEGATIEPGALTLIARAADGSVRDGLSLLDQAIAHGDGTVTEEQVRHMLGLADRVQVFDLFEALMTGDVGTALSVLAGQYALGADPLVVLQDLLTLAHWLTRHKVVRDADNDPSLPEAERTRGRTMADSLSMATLTRAWQMLMKGLAEARQAPDPLQAVEMALIRLAYASDLPSPAEAVARLTHGSGPDGAGPHHGGPPGGGAPHSSGNPSGPAEQSYGAAAGPMAQPPHGRPTNGRPTNGGPTSGGMPNGGGGARAMGAAQATALSDVTPQGLMSHDVHDDPAHNPRAGHPHAQTTGPGSVTRLRPAASSSAATHHSAPSHKPDAPQSRASSQDAPAPLPPMPGSFQAVVDLVRDRREVVLATHLNRDVHLVNFAPGRITLHPGPNAPRDLASRLERHLGQWTGRRWTVSISDLPGEQTLYETLQDSLHTDPLIQAVLETFPGATIGTVRTRSADLATDTGGGSGRLDKTGADGGSMDETAAALEDDVLDDDMPDPEDDPFGMGFPDDGFGDDD